MPEHKAIYTLLVSWQPHPMDKRQVSLWCYSERDRAERHFEAIEKAIAGLGSEWVEANVEMYVVPLDKGAEKLSAREMLEQGVTIQ